ncbi:MAG: DUF6513 domain-containing protein [Planctomycetota bacterium]|nr:DUF6513 domain-containing protein [Planctomycetota bacterium]MDA1212161.1 DUF6513 domain-containing protein [Planctomycetota bacterium]
MNGERILMVTGRLAEPSLRRVCEDLRDRLGLHTDVCVIGVSVAALMHVELLLRRLVLPAEIERVILPGWCQGDLNRLHQHFGVPFTLGPKDLFDLPDFLGSAQRIQPAFDEFDIEIVAEINHAPRMSSDDLLKEAKRLVAQGADVIDLGCIPGETWSGVAEATSMLVAEGLRVSIDSFDRSEVESAVNSGAELVLSCNGTNIAWGADLPAELVVIPDDPTDLASLESTIEILDSKKARYRIDPILEPIGHGFAKSLERYFTVRRRWLDVPMLMGVGNLTELTDVDSAGVNLLLAAICQELGIHSILTTQVINWARTTVQEFDIARRLVHHSVTRHVVLKRLSDQLVMLRDPKLHRLDPGDISRLADQIQDPNYRILVGEETLHLFNRDGHWQGDDPFELFEQALSQPNDVSAAHAFYLGFEMCKALTALTLGKQYVQDEALNWGFLTRPEKHTPPSHRVDTNPKDDVK